MFIFVESHLMFVCGKTIIKNIESKNIETMKFTSIYTWVRTLKLTLSELDFLADKHVHQRAFNTIDPNAINVHTVWRSLVVSPMFN